MAFGLCFSLGACLDPKPDPTQSPDASEQDVFVAATAQDIHLVASQASRARTPVLVGAAGQMLAIVEAPRRGTANIEADGSIGYEAPANYNGYERLRYRVTDARGGEAEAVLHITIYEVAEAGAPMVVLPRIGIEAWEVAVIVNSNDATSVAIGEYYLEKRQIPAKNLIRVALPTDQNVLSPEDFAPIYDQVLAASDDAIQAFALAWLRPYRVGCMSITSAFALGGYADRYCNTSDQGCSETAAVGYFRSQSTRPFDDFALRPTMMLAGTSEEHARDLIDRGVAADHTFPQAEGYMVRTSDEARSVRWPDMLSIANRWSSDSGLKLNYINNADGSGENLITDKSDVMFYFTGLVTVAGIETNTYLPGAVADHLTSFGGDLMGAGQMSILRWLEAGATASYGTVVEPCNYPTKFAELSTFFEHYYRGQSVVEAYWKSVHWPGEGVFVGEPLAKPWGRYHLRFEGNTLIIETTSLKPSGEYEVAAADAVGGPGEPVFKEVVARNVGPSTIVIEAATAPVYTLRLVP